MNNSIETILYYTIFAGLLSIVYGFVTGVGIIKSSSGNNKMQEIASAIQVGAKAYLNRQYKTIAIVGFVVLIIISFAFSFLVGVGYLVGATLYQCRQMSELLKHQGKALRTVCQLLSNLVQLLECLLLD